MEIKQFYHHQSPPRPPNSPFYESLIQAGPRLQPLQQVHANLIVSGSGRSRALLTKLLNLACASGSIGYTRQIFLSVPNPDSFLFNTLIKSTSKFNFHVDSLHFYCRMMLARIAPSSYTFTAVFKSCANLSALRIGKLIHGHAIVSGFGLDSHVQAALETVYSKSGSLSTAYKVFDKMPDKTIVAWNSMISGYEQNGLANEAIGLFYRMKKSSFKPDSTTLVSVLSACAQIGARDLGCWVHEHIRTNGFNVNVVLGTALINMYNRCGNVSKAREVFDSIDHKNVITWTAMISGYGMHGCGKEAVSLFHQMRTLLNPKPNSVTFIAVLSACAHSGLVDEGRSIFSSMIQEYGIHPGVEHHVCMVDLLGRAGFLTESYNYIKNQIVNEPAPAIWTAMLGSCKMHKNFDLGVEIAEHLLSLEPENPSHYVMLSNIYALAGKMDRVETIRNTMMQKCLNKQVGYTLIDIDNNTYLFSMGDTSHPETNAIYTYLDELMSRCREAGYVASDESVMHEVEEEEREFTLRYHSEKLAIAFGLLKTKDGTGLKIEKNLRMCEDCHFAIKCISVVTNREIVVRDKLRFHRFKDGLCSCRDYW